MQFSPKNNAEGTFWASLASQNYGLSRAHRNDGRGAEELVYRPMPGFAGGRSALADRSLHHSRTLGAAVGAAGDGLAICAASGPSAGSDGTGAGHHDPLDGLGASSLRADAVCGNRDDRWILAATLPDEAHGEGADVGFDLSSDCLGISDPVLGRAAGAAFAGGGVRV